MLPSASASYSKTTAIRFKPLNCDNGAGSGIRTRTLFRADAFETSMSACSIIPAIFTTKYKIPLTRSRPAA